MAYSVQSIVLHNGQDVSSIGWGITFDSGKAITQWHIELTEFLDVSITDTFSVMRAFGPPLITPIPGGLPAGLPVMTGAGGGSAVINNAHPDHWTKKVSTREAGMTVTGTTGGLSGGVSGTGGLLTVGVDVYFVSTDYLDRLAPDSWILKTDGALYYKSGSQSLSRLQGEGLPSKEVPSGTFQCIVGTHSHKAVGSWLAGRIGCSFHSNCPSINVKRVFHVTADKPVINAIVELYRLWQPTVNIQESPGGNMSIYVMDGAQSNPAPPQPHTYQLSIDAFEVADYTQPDGISEPAVDHVVIKGAKDYGTQNTVNYGTHLRPIDIPEVPLTENRDLHWTDSFDSTVAKKTMGDYTKGLTGKGAPAQKRPLRVERHEYYYEDPRDASNWILLREVSETYTYKGLTHSKETEHKYGKGFTPIGSVETESMLVNLPGRPDQTLQKVRIKIVDQSSVLDGLKRSLAKEITEEIMVANLHIPKNGDPPYFMGPSPIIQAQEQNKIVTEAATTQNIFEMTTKQRMVTVSRVTAGVLNQVTTEFDNVSGVTKTTSQIIKDPTKSNSERSEVQYVKHFYNGPSNKRAITIEHPDITDDAIAAEVAARVFARSSTPPIEMTLTMIAPLMIAATAFSVVVPPIPITQKTTSTTTSATTPGVGTMTSSTTNTTTIPGGTYVGVSLEEGISNGQHTITLKLMSTL